MRKLFVGLLLGIIAISFAAIPSTPARAGLTDYTTFFTAAHLYDDENLTIGFSGLDVSSSYRWTIQFVDDNTGEAFFDVGHYTHIPGTTTDAFTVGPSVTALINTVGDWPFTYTGPFQVKDNFGQIVMRGYLAPHPTFHGSTSWESNSGTNNWVDKVVLGTNTHVEPLTNPVYNGIISGWHYDPREFAGVTLRKQNEKYGLMHFNLDCATYIGATYGANDAYVIHDFSGTEIARFPLNELVDFQERELIWPPGGCGTANDEVFESFIPVNFSGDELPFVDNTRADAIFATYQNPLRTEFATGAYYIEKEVGAATVADGEAPFFVSDAPDYEWRIEISTNEVVENGNIGIVYRQFTESIWDHYHGATTCQNDQLTWTDSTVYSFVRDRSENRPVPNSALDNDFIECEHIPLSIGTITMTAAQASVIVESEFYDVFAGLPGPEDHLQTFLEGMKLDTDNGRNIAFVVVLFVSLFFVGLSPLRVSSMAWLLTWTFVGGLWVAFAPVTPLAVIMWAIITVVLWVFMLGARNGNEGGFEEI